MLLKRLFISTVVVIAAVTAAYAANTTFFTSKGDIVFPFSPPTKAGAAGTIDNMTIGATTKRAATVTTLAADSATVGGTAVSTVANGVGGVAAGYKIARGETALDGTNPTPIATGLATITGCAVTIKLATAPGLGTSVITYGTSTGTLNLYGWKPTGAGDTTLIASTGTETIGWVCAGT